MRNIQHRFRHSNLRNGLTVGPRSSRGVRSATLFVEISNLPAKACLDRVPSRIIATSRAPIRNPPIRNPRNPLRS
eukprot:14992633-Alexandrium_andersonii.AAC.1